MIYFVKHYKLNLKHFKCYTFNINYKILLQSLRDNGWDTFIKSVISVCESHHIDVPRMNDRHMKGTMRPCKQKDYVTVEHYCRIDLFNVVIDF